MSKKNKTIFIVDDDINFIIPTKMFLEDKGYDVIYSLESHEAIKMMHEKAFDVLLLDKNLPDISGLEILKSHIPASIDPVIIMVTAEPSILSAVEAIKLGASNYISKPYDDLELLFKIEKDLKFKKLQENNNELNDIVKNNYSLNNIIGNTPQFKQIQATIMQLKKSDTTILITGETGTGKTLIAKAIHFSSIRHKNPFVIINVGTLSNTILESELFGHIKGSFTGAHKDKIGLFQSAEGGTVLIDEIGDMPFSMQIKLLRVIEDKEFVPVGSTKTVTSDIRIIAATHQPLEKLIEEKKFREDLYYRLNVVNLEAPPLRKRKEDILPLANHFLKIHCEKNEIPGKIISEKLLQAFYAYKWPGNIRELENCIEHMVLLSVGETLTISSLPEKIRQFLNQGTQNSDNNSEFYFGDSNESDKSLENIEKEYLIHLLQKHNGKINILSSILNLSRKTIYRKLLKHGIDKQYFKD